ncbi:MULTISPECIES: hypothetical protein [unclassified Caulobacter]|jgi:hypothetical protein|uniref:hypothetical protein n=1 Tax=unclassified Caulobacter TaxID=2648921 RepID=UPI0012E3F9E7|nr:MULTISPECIES: hypothetical protein [unclassified Caulobacter]
MSLAGAAAATGLLLGGGFWAVTGGAQGKALGDVEARLDAVSTKTRRPLERPSDALAKALALPLLGHSEVGEQADLPLRLTGIVRTPARAAALLAIGGAPAQWISVGEEQQGVLVQTVSTASVVVSTANGEREIFLGPASESPNASETPPPGMRGPPPPASAPSMK